jgi:hypothetical protein
MTLFRNAHVYNRPGSMVWDDSITLYGTFVKEMRTHFPGEVVPSIGIQGNGKQTPSKKNGKPTTPSDSEVESADEVEVEEEEDEEEIEVEEDNWSSATKKRKSDLTDSSRRSR